MGKQIRYPTRAVRIKAAAEAREQGENAGRSSKSHFTAVVIVLVLGIFCGIGYGWFHGSNGDKTENGLLNTQAGALSDKDIDEQTEEILDSMSLTEKIGQMMMIGVQGTEADADSLYVLHQFHYGGIIFFDRNLTSADQTKAMISDLQKNAQEKLPLFMAIDEEGGLVVRGAEFISPPPSQEEAASQGKPEYVKSLAMETAGSLRELGFNVNFAPVADVGSGDGRSYSEDAQTVAEFVQAAGNGYKASNMIYALKHFPGIGRGRVDSHEEISSIEATAEEMENRDLVPFKAIIDATEKGSSLDYMVMVGHLNYPAWDEDNPASMSQAIITDLLRQKLGYQGLVITDDLEMGAIAKHLSFRQAGLAAVKAGADIVLVCHEYAHAEEAYMGIYDAVRSGAVSEERINESVRRIIKAKLLHGMQAQE